MKQISLQSRLMLQQYELQLMTARRLARHRRRQLVALEEEAPDPHEHRENVVQRVAHELYSTLLSTGTDNPVVEDIVHQLGEAMGGKVLLNYPTPSPLHEEHLRLLRQPDKGKPVPLNEAENHKALQLLWNIVLRTVDKTTI